MSELDDLHAAILADPDSDEPRLVYADALQAAGDPRGELIAIQCELARLGCDRTRLALWDPPSEQSTHRRRDWIADAFVDASRSTVRALRAREAQLLASHGEAWSSGSPNARFRRGFVEHLHVRTLPDAGLAGLPLLRSLEVDEFRDDPVLPGLEQLRCSLAGDACHEAFRASAGRSTLRELALADHGVLDPIDLAELPRTLFTNLRALDLCGYPLATPSQLQELTSSLEELRLGEHASEEGAAILEVASRGSSLSTLDCYLLEAGDYHALFEPGFAGLQALRIHELELPDVSPVLALNALRVLDLGGTPSAGLIYALAKDDHLFSLSQLGLRESEIESHHLAMLSQTPLFSRLRVLDLSANVGLTEVFDIGASESLELIDLRGTQIRDIARLQQRCPNAEILTS